MSKVWYAYIGAPGQEYTLNRYRFIGTVPGGCNDGYAICSIYAAYGGLNPATLSAPVQNYISRVLANGTNQPDPSIGGGKLFAYGKTINP